MKATKASVDYSPGMRDAHCGKVFKEDRGYCRHFVPSHSQAPNDNGSCTEVAGSIGRVYWCRLFSKAQSRGSTPDPAAPFLASCAGVSASLAATAQSSATLDGPTSGALGVATLSQF
jgi:hypothetical protein